VYSILYADLNTVYALLSRSLSQGQGRSLERVMAVATGSHPMGISMRQGHGTPTQHLPR
jgi:hypothetical protein